MEKLFNVNSLPKIEKINTSEDVEKIVNKIIEVSVQYENVKSDKNKHELLETMNTLNETLKLIAKPYIIQK